MGLQYDDSAFYYFLLSSFTLYLIPSYWYILKSLYGYVRPRSEKDLGAVVRTTEEKKKSQLIKKRATASSEIFKPTFLFNLLLTTLITLCAVYLIYNLSQDSEIATFDPYEILGIDRSTENKGIKSAYRKKSLKYHPDKNPDNPAAEATFMLIAKAYEALTDETAKANWEKYGNPDGKQSLEVSIGLPTFLLDGQWKYVILLSYLFGMVVLVPSVVWFYYSNSSKYGENNVMYKTWAWINHAINEKTTVASMPEVLSGCVEFHELLMPRKEDMERDTKAMKSLEPMVKPHMHKPKYTHILVVKGNYLVHAHCIRATVPGFMQDQLDSMLRGSGNLVKAFIEQCHQRMWMGPAKEVIVFNQMITQGVWIKQSQMLQMPHFGKGVVQQAAKTEGMGGSQSLEKYLGLDADVRANALKEVKELNDEQRSDIATACAIIPRIDLSVSTFVEDDEDQKIYANDLITVRVKVDRLNLEKGEEVGLVHAPRFPAPRRESWWIILATKDGKIVSIENVAKTTKVFNHDIKFMAPPQGAYDMVVHVLSNDYVGLDKESPLHFDVNDPALLPKFVPHKEDMELDEEPTMFEQMMAGNIEEDSEDEDSDSDVEDVTAKATKKVKKASSDSDSDSDDEDMPVLKKEGTEGKKDQ